jgi:hypothetical protein
MLCGDAELVVKYGILLHWRESCIRLQAVGSGSCMMPDDLALPQSRSGMNHAGVLMNPEKS